MKYKKSKEMPSILQRCADLGYAIFTKKDYDLNIIGVPSPNRIAGKFDDEIHCVYKERGEWVHETYQATTDPSAEQHLNPSNSKGVAILKAGQYRGVYCLDLHRNSYLALCQRKGEVTVYRDQTGDKISDIGGDTKEDTGYFGINIHRAASAQNGSLAISTRYYSAGCQVFVHPADFARFISLCKMQVGAGIGDTFSYTLLED